jgi:hypothetical protein
MRRRQGYGCPRQGRRRIRHRLRQQSPQRHQRGQRRDRLRRPPRGAADRRVEHPGRDLLLSDNVGADGAAPRPSASRAFDHLVDTDQLPSPRMPSIGHRYLGGICDTVGLVSWSSTTPSARIRAWRPARPTRPTSALRRSVRLREFPAGVGEVVEQPGASPSVDLWTTQERCPQPHRRRIHKNSDIIVCRSWIFAFASSRVTARYRYPTIRNGRGST